MHYATSIIFGYQLMNYDWHN